MYWTDDPLKFRLNLTHSMIVQVGSLEFHLLGKDNEWKPHPTRLWFYQKRKKTSFSGFVMWKRLHASKSLQQKSNMLLFFLMCVYMQAGMWYTFAHGMWKPKDNSGVPNHFPLYLSKQGLLLNSELMDSSNLATQITWGFPSCFPSTGMTGGPPCPPGS